MGGSRFDRDHRIVLMLIKEQHSELGWLEVQTVFNIIFPAIDRTLNALKLQWKHRKKEKKADWDAARHNLGQQDQSFWTQKITSIVNDLGYNSNTDEAQAETESEAENPPGSEDGQETLQERESDNEREVVAAVQDQIHEQDAVDVADGGITDHEAANVQHPITPGGGSHYSALRYSGPGVYSSDRSYDRAIMSSSIRARSSSFAQGDWRFVSEEDAKLAFMAISGFGGSDYPSAADVHWWRSKQECFGLPTTLADGINIVWVPGAPSSGT